MIKGIRTVILLLSINIVAKSVCAQDYYINASNKEAAFSYYFKVMDSLVSVAPNDTLFFCINCIRFMQQETRIQSSGKTTSFGRMDFRKEDLQRWHEWFEKYRRKQKSK